jgi:hypothetical protein
MSYPTSTTTRFKTGEICTISGGYQFDGYTDGSGYPPPKQAEQKIPVSKGERFPPIRSTGKACWWLLISRL